MKATSAPLTAFTLAATLSAAVTTVACANEAQSDVESDMESDRAALVTTQTIQTAHGETYLDAPQTPGTWTYVKEPDETLAIYGEGRRAPAFVVRCANGVVSLGRFTQADQTETRAMRVTTETVTSQMNAVPVAEMAMILAVDLEPMNPLLDAMAITKGRFKVDVTGLDPLYLPAWVEVSRVIEDCRV